MNLANRRKTITLFIVWVLILTAAWFATPALLRNSIRLAAVLPHRALTVQLDSTVRAQLTTELEQLKEELFAKKRRGEKISAALLLDIGIRYETLGALWKAYPYAVDAIEREPTNTSAWSHHASIQEGMTLYASAADSWREAIERDPKNVLFYERLGYLYDRYLNDEFMANGVYLEGLVRAGNPPNLMRSYAQFLEEVGQGPTALLYWKALSEMDPSDTTIKDRIRDIESRP